MTMKLTSLAALASAALALSLTALPASAQKLAGCENGACSASGLSTQALSDIARADTPASSAQRDELRSPARPSDPWNRHMPVRADLESYDCILSFGVGGELSKSGFLGTRVLGRTQQWSSPASTATSSTPR